MNILQPTEIINWLHLMLVRDLNIATDVYLDTAAKKIYIKPKYIFKDMIDKDVEPNEFGFVISVDIDNMTLVQLKLVIQALLTKYIQGGRELILINEETKPDEQTVSRPEVANGDVSAEAEDASPDREPSKSEGNNDSQLDAETGDTNTSAEDGEDR